MTEQSNNILTTLIVAGTIFGSILISMSKIDQGLTFLDKQLHERAVQGCLEVSKYIHTDVAAGNTTEEPMQTSVDNCLKLKGY